MILKSLKLKNIRSYEDMELEFPSGTVLLSGDIGSGKTTVLLGLAFALFGLQPGQKGNSLLRQGTEDAYVKLEIDIEGKTVTLERTIKKSKSGSITQDVNIIDYDGKSEELSTSEMKDRVIDILNYPKEFVKKTNLLYKYTVYTPQEEMKSIIEERPEIRLDTIRHIFGIDRYKRIKENAQIFINRLKENIKVKEILCSELNLLKEKLNLENEKKISLAREVNNLKIEYQSLLKEKLEIENRLKEKEKKIEEKKNIDSKISSIEITIRGKTDLELRLKKEIMLMQRQANEEIDFSDEKIRNVISLLESHKKNLEEKNSGFLRLVSQISVLKSKKEEYQKLVDQVSSLENCPTCFQNVGHQHKEKISKKTKVDIDSINYELEHKLMEKQSMMKEIENEKRLIEEYEKDQNELNKNKVKYDLQREIKTKLQSDAFVLDRTTNEILSLRKEIEDLKSRLSEFSDISEKYIKLKEEAGKTFEIVRKKEILLATKEKELEILKMKLEELSTDITQKENTRLQMDHLKGLSNWITENFLNMIILTEKNVLAKLRHDFSSIFSEWFSMLAPSNLSVRLDEDFSPIINNQDYEIEYDFLSGGERTAIALAYRLALNQVLNSFLSKIKTKDLVILDEPTDGFSSEQLDKMRDIFQELNMKQIILVSHEQKIEGFVDHVIRIKKDKTSSIER